MGNSAKAKILLVDDEENVRNVLRIVLKGSGYAVSTADSEEQARKVFLEENPDLVLQDMRLNSSESGIELLNFYHSHKPDLPVIIITAYSNWESTLNSMQEGAYDFIKKPFDNESIREVVARALAHRENSDAPGLEGTRKKDGQSTEILGNTPAMREVMGIITRVATTDSTVLVTGESGTGKELVARALHYCSNRASNSFISVNSGAFPENLLESELFGHVKGSFSGAMRDKEGLISVADRGTFFFDEVGDIQLDMQVKLLRVIEEQQFFPVGGTSPKTVNVRFIGATNKDLYLESQAGRFREDLYYRLNVIPIHLPPLRERKDDIDLLVSHFLTKYAQKMQRNITSVSQHARSVLFDYDWPGNVRELQNTIERSIALSSGTVLDKIYLQRRPGQGNAPVSSVNQDDAGPSKIAMDMDRPGFKLEDHMETIERKYIEAALEKTNGHLTNAAKILGISFRSIRYKVQKLGIKV